MSDIFSLDAKGWESVTDSGGVRAVDIGKAPPGFFDNAASAIGEGVMRGGARVGQLLGMAASVPVGIAEPFLGYRQGELTDKYFASMDENVNSAVDYWAPNAQETGTAGRVLGGLSEIALPLMAGGGNPTLMLGSQEMGTAVDLTRQGVDADTATAAGVVQGAAAAAGFRIPFLGKSLATRMASGAAGNLVVNAGASAATQRLLEGQGYVEQAQSFDPMNAEARIVDVLSGMVFGGIAHAGAKPYTEVEKSATAAAANAKHFASDTAPGVPVDLESAAAHQAAVEQAIGQMMRGEPVTVPESLDRASFIPREPAVPEARPVDFYHEEAKRIVVEMKAAKDINTNDPSAVSKLVGEKVLSLSQFVRSKGGITDGGGELAARDINGKTAPGVVRKEGTPNRGIDDVRQEAFDAGYFPDKQAYTDITDSELLDAIAADATGERRYQVKVQERLAAVERDVRMLENMAQHGIQREMSVDQVAEQLRSIDEEARQYAAEPNRVDPAILREYDVQPPPEPKPVTVEAPKAEPAAPVPAEAPAPAGEPTGATGPEQVRSDALVGAAEAAAESGLKVTTGETAGDGSAAVVSAADLLARAREEVAKAKNDAKGFKAAVDCFLRVGT